MYTYVCMNGMELSSIMCGRASTYTSCVMCRYLCLWVVYTHEFIGE